MRQIGIVCLRCAPRLFVLLAFALLIMFSAAIPLTNEELRVKIAACQAATWLQTAPECVNISTWDTSQVTNMSTLFSGSFNLDISGWNTASVTDMSKMFKDAYAFDKDLSQWNTAMVTNLTETFYSARSFNGDISAWDTRRVTKMNQMFRRARLFNNDLSAWDTSQVTNMSEMFDSADNFNQPIGMWDTSSATDFTRMFIGARVFNQDLSRWMTSKVTSISYMFLFAPSFNGDVSSWDTSQTTSMTGTFAFAFAFNRDVSGWNTSQVTSMSSMFSLARAFNQSLTSWDVRRVEKMNSMFSGAASFNSDISRWNTGSVTNMGWAFASSTIGSSQYNNDISKWDTSRVTVMESMFFRSTSFNGDISGWNVDQVVDMRSMFRDATAFNVDLCDWNLHSTVDTDAHRVFEGSPKLTACDVNECVDQNDDLGCNLHSVCTNTETSFTCTCASGYQEIDVTTGCVDVDECSQQKLNNCDSNTKCSNTEGSFLCECNTGFAGDGVSCDCLAGFSPHTSVCGSLGGEQALGSHKCFFVPSALPVESWIDAEQTCSSHGGHLASIASQAENEMALQLYVSSGARSVISDGRMWIGLNDRDAEGIWEWSDGSNVSYASWAPGQPNDYQGQQDCAHIWKDGTVWQDDNCEAERPFLCTLTTDVAAAECRDVDECAVGRDNCPDGAVCTNTVGSFECQCEEGFWGNGTLCIDVDECTEEARKVCPGDHVACINTPGSFLCECDAGYSPSVCSSLGGEQALGSHKCFFVPSALPVESWIDAEQTCSSHGGHLASIASQAENDMALQLYVSSGARSVISDGRMWIGLNDRDAEGIWEWSDGSNVSYASWAPEQPNDYQGQQDCAHIWKDGTVWQDDNCEAERPFLCTLTTDVAAAECRDVDECAAGRDNCPDGAVCTNTVGSFECQCEEGFWGNGTLCIDVDECTEEARKVCPGDHVACINTPGSFLCECDAGYSPSVCSSLGGEQALGSRKCFFVPSALPVESWIDAEQTCSSHGGHLASIASQAENDMALQLYVSSGARSVISDGRMWIGLNDRDAEGIWEWSDGSNVSYASWAPGQPNDYQGQQDCAHIWKDGTVWQDDNCEAERPFLCTLTTDVAAAECRDVDECAVGRDNCPDGAVCTNTVGSFECQSDLSTGED